jgi:hypothetical protein
MLIRKFCPRQHHYLSSYNHAPDRYLPDQISEIAKSASVTFTFKSVKAFHCKIAAVMNDPKGIFSVEMNNNLILMKFSPMISDELNVDLLFESEKHYDININISLWTGSQSVSIFLQSSTSITSEFLDEYCFACKSENSLQPIQIQVREPSSTSLSGFDCNVEFDIKNDHAMEGSFL